MCVGRYGISGKFVGINYALLPNREWNKKQKHKKQPWSNVECFAFGGATVRFASLETSSHATHQSLRHPLTRAHHIAPRIKTARRSRRKTPGDKMNSWKEVVSNFPNDFAWQGRDTSRPRQIVDIQYDTTIMGGREVSRPYRVWFFAEGERFLSF